MFTGFGFSNHRYPLTLTDDGERIPRAHMTTSAADFYDALAPWYHLIYEDWQASIERQGAALESVMRSAVGGECRTVLDVACGIGTQSLGLAGRGVEVTASDVSAAAVERARREALQRGLSIGLSVADMRRAHAHHGREFDVVLCADNSLPHLLSDEDISAALREFFLCTRPGGVTILSVRDYSQVERGGTQVKPYGVRGDGPTRYVLVQVWDWRDPLYDLSFYVVRDDGNSSCHTQVARSTYYAISIPALVKLMERAGFVDVRRVDDAYFQPLVIGKRPEATPTGRHAPPLPPRDG